MIIRVSGHFTRLLTQWLIESGIIDSPLQLRLAQMGGRETVAAEEWREVLASAARHSPDSWLGLEIGSQVTLSHLGVLGFLVLNCETLEEALQTYALSERRFYGVNFCSLAAEGERYTLSWPDHLGDANALFVQVALATLVTFLRQRFPTTFSLCQVALTEQPPVQVEPYQRFFGCPVVFGSTRPGITVDREKAAATEGGSLPDAISHMQDQQVQAFVDVIAENTPFLQQVQSALLRLIPRGEASLSQLAGAVEVSPRTLQRRLGDYHLSYQSLLDGLRENLSYRYLKQDNLTQVEIAFLLGFSEQSAFNRAFRQWTGGPPGRYRDSHPAGGK